MRRSLGVMLFITVVAGLFIVAFAQVPAQTLLKNAPSADDYPGMEGVYLLDEGINTYMPHGTSTYVMHQCLRLLTHEGVKDYGEVQVPYDSKTEEIHLDYARTITPDGREVIPDKSAIHEVTLPAAQDAPMYSSIKLYTISMPALEPGAIIDYQITIEDKQTHPKGEESDFSDIWYFAYDLPVQTSRYVVHVPKKVPIRWQVKGIDLAPTVQTGSDTVTYTFLRKDIPAIGYEPYMPDLDALSPLVVITSFGDWNEVAAWYNDLAADRVQTDSDIVAKVNELTAGIQTPSEKISKIYDFVAHKVRYVAIEFGLGGYQPHPAPKTFVNRYGDCKDQATLLITMLRVAGFKAYPVLLRVGAGVDVDFDLPPAVQMFNHVIVAVRLNDKWMFLDPTCDICTTSYLPYSDRNRHVMIILGKKDRPGLITTTDPFDPMATYENSDVHAVLSSAGDLHATAVVSTGGDDSLEYRDLLLSYRPSEREKLLGQVLNMAIPGAVLASLTYSDLNDTHIPVRLTMKFTKSGFAQTAAGMLLFPTPCPIPFSTYFASMIGQKTRTYPIMNVPKVAQEQVSFAVPDGMSVQLPSDIHVTNTVGSFTSHYVFTGGKITVTRVLKLVLYEIQPSEYPLFKEVVQALIKDLNAMIVLKPTK